MDGSAWTSGDCGHRVVRGGSFYNVPQDLRAANVRGNGLGFRVGRDACYPLNLYLLIPWVQGEAVAKIFEAMAPVTDNSKRTGAAIEAHISSWRGLCRRSRFACIMGGTVGS
jgi:hypothetical protein